MKDLHNHVLYGIDDGSINLDNSIELLNELENNGVTDIVVTPHYIVGSNYNCNNLDKIKILNKLQAKTKINLYLGNEIMIDEDILKYIECNEISTINNSRYVLIEFYSNMKLKKMYDIIEKLIDNNYIPIIAHPERYHNLSVLTLKKLIFMGCLLQGNITSLQGKYGIEARKNLELLLKKHMIHLLGTDTHRHGTIDLNLCISKLNKIVDKNMADDLLNNNFDKVVNNINIDAYKIISTKTLFERNKMR